ncbi:stage III sporulation protein AA [Desulfonispora thiosulfatigenes DSM 11270]|uniref:Stage III sporulation protein AA n=1 Tax=Desulfonispora thiosulfatigenes DSM 11270 TaxID=656914 RepID=A0A1W1VN51_DESTI|nr:stage III sporulation protein AA [Desulfonispora thiosulfatigenes]SMB94792.1 stage III sporulation protein AA [Desulfonispora thiosulfatigenes DSM 11270]
MTNIKIIKKETSSPLQKNVLTEILPFFPQNIRDLVLKIPDYMIAKIEEIRIRLNRPLVIVTEKDNFAINHKEITKNLEQGYFITQADINKILHLISQSSIYAWEEEFKRGYITLKGGHRVGITGKAVLNNGMIKTLKDISGLNFRIAKEILGAATKILPYIIKSPTEIEHTLIVSPPRCGKTTLLRDIVRQLSMGISKLNFLGVNVGLVDERSEIAGSYNGDPQYNVGFRTDILDGCPKAQGMLMLIRSMSPQVIVTDEIGTREDVLAMEEVLNSGINLLTTVHGADINEIKRRPNLNMILNSRIFTRIIILSRSRGVGTVEDILDGYTYKSLLLKNVGERNG